ncbi:MAG: FecR family protein [Candidatus Solibacter sp.]
MKRLLLMLLPAVLFAGQARYARLGEFQGNVEVQLRAADPWMAAERNLPLIEGVWLRTGASARLEIELDEGSAWRLGPDSQVELSDYTRLATGQRLTVIALDHGVAYFTGEPGGHDTLTLVVPGGQITLSRGARVRLQADAGSSRISVIEGTVRLYCPAAELDLREGQTVRLEPANPARFALERDVPSLEWDRWSEERDKALASSSSGVHVAQRFGLNDLDAAGEWVQTDLGPVWKPKVEEGWAPFQKGRWRWYDALGYTWVSDEPWGWVPYHFGRWTRKGELGWVWTPAASPVFKPGEVFWLYNAKLAGWGPLGPGENWVTSERPEQFLNVNTTYANFQQDAGVIDPAGFKDRPKEPLGVATLALALPSPSFPAARLEATRPDLRVGTARMRTEVPGTEFQEMMPPPAPPPLPPAIVTNPADDAPPVISSGPPPDPGPPGPPMQVIYPVPVYTGIVVLNPPEHPDYSRRNPNAQGGKGSGSQGNSGNSPAPVPAAQTPTPVRSPGASGTMPAPRTGPLTPPGAMGRPNAPPVTLPKPATTNPTPTPPAPVPTTSTPAPTAPPAPPRVMLPGPRGNPGDHPATVPLPVGRELPRVSNTESKSEGKPQMRPESKQESKPQPKADPPAPKADAPAPAKQQ